jgi:hypothetical protein
MPSPTKPAAKKPVKGKPDRKKSWIGPAAGWGFVIVAVIGIVLMIVNAPREKRLNCSGGSSSLIGFGSCTAE